MGRWISRLCLERRRQSAGQGLLSIAGDPVVTAICILLFIGAMGKLGGAALRVWLPDAMEGPTPVSALIHAATMVTAGVYMVARCNAQVLAPTALQLVAVVGAATAIFAASIGLVQNDIKKVLAYSDLGVNWVTCFWAAGGGLWSGDFPSDDACLFQGPCCSWEQAGSTPWAGSRIYGRWAD
ncbi:MAG: proton-conducting transporter membrane subunit [Terriglobia bacterium]